MSDKQRLRDFYTQVLNALGVEDVGEGKLSLKYPSEDGKDICHNPATIGGDRLILPIDERLDIGDLDGVVMFHPMSEHPLRGESDVIKVLRDLVEFNLQLRVHEILTVLLEYAADNTRQQQLTAQQSRYLEKVPDIDKKTLKEWEQIRSRYISQLVSVYIKRSAKVNNKEYKRAAIISFPILSELDSDGSSIYSTSVRKKTKKALSSLMHHVLGEGIDKGIYNAGSNSDDAPNFVSLMRAYSKLGKHLSQEWIEPFENLLGEKGQLLKINTDFIKKIDKVSSYRDIIPPLPGNEGNHVKKTEQANTQQNTGINNAAQKVSQRQRGSHQQVQPQDQPQVQPQDQSQMQPQAQQQVQPQPQQQQPIQQNSSEGSEKLDFIDKYLRPNSQSWQQPWQQPQWQGQPPQPPPQGQPPMPPPQYPPQQPPWQGQPPQYQQPPQQYPPQYQQPQWQGQQPPPPQGQPPMPPPQYPPQQPQWQGYPPQQQPQGPQTGAAAGFPSRPMNV